MWSEQYCHLFFTCRNTALPITMEVTLLLVCSWELPFAGYHAYYVPMGFFTVVWEIMLVLYNDLWPMLPVLASFEFCHDHWHHMYGIKSDANYQNTFAALLWLCTGKDRRPLYWHTFRNIVHNIWGKEQNVLHLYN